MVPVVPRIFRADQVVSPEDINENFRFFREVQESLSRKQWAVSTVTIPLRSFTDTDPAAQRTLAIRPPRGCQIVARELIVYGTASVVYTVASTNAGWTNMTVTGLGATSAAIARDVSGVQLSADEELDFIISASATATVAHAELVLHFIHTPHSIGRPVVSVTELDSADTASAAKTAVNAAITAFASGADSLGHAAGNELRPLFMTAVPFGDIDHTGTIPTLERDIPIPDLGLFLRHIDLLVVGDVGVGDVTAQVLNAAGTPQVTATCTPVDASTLVKHQVVAAEVNQPAAGTAASNDWKVRFARTNAAGTLYRAVAFLYWDKE